jgi:RES domain
LIAPGPKIPTEFGPVQCTTLDEERVHHVGYKPDPWIWAPWEFAQGGRFSGRWDDSDGEWRAKYVGATRVACYLEVLASFRPDPTLEADMDVIESDDDEFPTIPPGRLDYGWCDERLVCTARLSGCFAVPSHHETLPTLREQFLPLATALGLTDIDAAAVREGEPRELTQSMSAWIYEIVGPDGERIDGIQYLSRHGDDLALWAIYERGSTESPPEVTARDEPGVISPDDEDLAEAMRIHRITWLSNDR